MMSRFTRCIRAVALVAVVAGAMATAATTAGAGQGTSVVAATTAGAGPGRFNHTEMTVAVPAITMVDDTGAAVRLDRLLATAEPVALQFVFTSCPGVCPTLSSTLAALGRKVPAARLVSISIDPEVDTVARLSEYKAQFQGGERWSLLTGSPADSIAAQQAFASYRGEKMRHQALTFLKPAGSGAWLRFEGFPAVEELAAALTSSPHGDPALGKHLYQEGLTASGAPLEVRLPTGGTLSGRAAACANCHRPSGFGSVEAGMYLPPVTGPYLFGGRENRRVDLFHELFQAELGFEIWARLRQRPARPAYTVESLGVALASGHDPSGRLLDAMMPRYELDTEDLSNLHAYLATLGASSDPGVDGESILFATVVDGAVDTPEEKARLMVLKAFFRLKNDDTLRLRQRPPDPLGHEDHFAAAYRLWRLTEIHLDLNHEGARDELTKALRESPPFALLAGPGGPAGEKVAAVCAELGLPCLLLDESRDGFPAGEVVRWLAASPCPAGSTTPPQAFRARQWLRARGIGAEFQEATALATHHLLNLTEAAVLHLLDDFSRALFLEIYDREAGRVESPLVCASPSPP